MTDEEWNNLPTVTPDETDKKFLEEFQKDPQSFLER